MGDLCGTIISRLTKFETPKGHSSCGANSQLVGIILGLCNIFFLFGIGTIISGCLSSPPDVADIIIGVLQLVLPFVGWLWSIIWGILMIIRSA